MDRRSRELGPTSPVLRVAGSHQRPYEKIGWYFMKGADQRLSLPTFAHFLSSPKRGEGKPRPLKLAGSKYPAVG